MLWHDALHCPTKRVTGRGGRYCSEAPPPPRLTEGFPDAAPSVAAQYVTPTVLPAGKIPGDRSCLL